MASRLHHPQPVAAAKAGFSERTGRRVETGHRLPPGQATDQRRSRNTADPFLGLWDGEIRPMLEAKPGLRPVTLLEEMQRRHPDHDWDRLRRSLERRVRAWCSSVNLLRLIRLPPARADSTLPGGDSGAQVSAGQNHSTFFNQTPMMAVPQAHP